MGAGLPADIQRAQSGQVPCSAALSGGARHLTKSAPRFMPTRSVGMNAAVEQRPKGVCSNSWFSRSVAEGRTPEITRAVGAGLIELLGGFFSCFLNGMSHFTVILIYGAIRLTQVIPTYAESRLNFPTANITCSHGGHRRSPTTSDFRNEDSETHRAIEGLQYIQGTLARSGTFVQIPLAFAGTLPYPLILNERGT